MWFFINGALFSSSGCSWICMAVRWISVLTRASVLRSVRLFFHFSTSSPPPRLLLLIKVLAGSSLRLLCCDRASSSSSHSIRASCTVAAVLAYLHRAPLLPLSSRRFPCTDYSIWFDILEQHHNLWWSSSLLLFGWCSLINSLPLYLMELQTRVLGLITSPLVRSRRS